MAGGGGSALGAGRFARVILVCLFALAMAVVGGALAGPGGFEFSGIFPFDPEKNPHVAGLLYLRLPRVLLAAIVGASLSAVGVCYQALLRNPLADPFVMGVSGGAALGGTLALVVGGAGLGLGWQAPAAFAGAVCATLLVYGLGRVGGRIEPVSVLLVGVVFNAFASAVIMFLKTVVSAVKAQEMLFWLMGTLGYYDYTTLGWLAAAVVVLVVALQAFSGNLNALVIGEAGATQLGVDVEVAKRFVFLAASALVGLAVSVSGLIGFVGLMVPHLARLMLGPDHRLLLPAATILGGAFLVLADLVARLAFVVAGSEPPVGVITAFLGGPFFLLLLRRRRRYVV